MFRARTSRIAVLVALTIAAWPSISARSDVGADGGASNRPGGTIPAAGGTLRLAMVSDVFAGFDPQKEYFSVAWEYFRCCLLRTLMSYNGRPAADGGSRPLPDLAAGPPTVSADGLTWTFTLKRGIRYGPPLGNVTVKARDIIRALNREACRACMAGGYPFYYRVIRGWDAFVSRNAARIAGLSAPDDRTLVVRLNRPAGYLPHLFAMPATAPIPPFSDRRFGVAFGHDRDFGRFLVATGPYMFAGSRHLDFSLPPREQEPVAGYRPGRSIQLVRNPSWDPATDRLRVAFADRIAVAITDAKPRMLERRVDRGTLDLVFDGAPSIEQVRRYLDSERLQDQVHRHRSDVVRYISMNVAQPPFDDVYVRRALNYLLDKRRLRNLRSGPLFADIARHAIVESTLGERLRDFDPYPTPNDRGSLAKARAEMRLSRYDHDGNGRCDVLAACRKVLAVGDRNAPYPEMTAYIANALAGIGITLDVTARERSIMYTICIDPRAHAALCLSPGWGKDFPDAFTFAPWLFGGDSIGPDACCNYSLLGAGPGELRKYGYERRRVPSVDAEIRECVAMTGNRGPSCWAGFDRMIMKSVVPWVPYQFDVNMDVTSERITGYSFSQFSGVAALDRLAVA